MRNASIINYASIAREHRIIRQQRAAVDKPSHGQPSTDSLFCFSPLRLFLYTRNGEAANRREQHGFSSIMLVLHE